MKYYYVFCNQEFYCYTTNLQAHIMYREFIEHDCFTVYSVYVD